MHWCRLTTRRDSRSERSSSLSPLLSLFSSLLRRHSPPPHPMHSFPLRRVALMIKRCWLSMYCIPFCCKDTRSGHWLAQHMENSQKRDVNAHWSLEFHGSSGNTTQKTTKSIRPSSPSHTPSHHSHCLPNLPRVLTGGVRRSNSHQFAQSLLYLLCEITRELRRSLLPKPSFLLTLL